VQALNRSRLMIVDSMALLFRGFYATAVTGEYMRTQSGLYTNGVYQFTKYLLDAIKRFRPTHVVCAFDMGKETFRNELFSAYKANRGEPPMELIPQFDLVRELIEAFNIPIIGVEGYEADDVMGTLARKAVQEGYEVLLLTGDGDSLQLVDDGITVVMMKKGFGNYEIVSKENLFEIKGVNEPQQIVELKSLMGDASDNIPGCPGVGPKTAIKLLQEYANVDAIYENIDHIKGKLKDRLLGNRDLVYLSRELARIRTDVPFECNLEACKLSFDREKIEKKFEELEFRSLRSWINI
jgi:5'-3' exonuclease